MLHHCFFFFGGGTLLPSIYADARYVDAVIVSKAEEYNKAEGLANFGGGNGRVLGGAARSVMRAQTHACTVRDET